MSHFTVAVISDPSKGGSLSETLMPYHENDGYDHELEELGIIEFKNVEEEYRENYKTNTTRRLQLPDGTNVNPYEAKFRVNGSYTIPEGYTEVELKVSDVYLTFEEYIEEYCGYQKEDDRGYGYWHNPNAKWDWYDVGGRWKNKLKLKNGSTTNFAYIKDIDFSPDKVVYDQSIRFWELYIEKQEPKDEEEKELIQWTFYKESYYTDKYKTKEEYAKREASFTTFAVITSDGKWHEKGEMGWFACHTATMDEEEKWDKSFFDAFLKDTPGEFLLTIVDCHI